MKTVAVLRMGVFFFALLALAVAPPAAVWGQALPTLNHSLEPGSVLIFPEFLTGTVANGDGTRVPRSSFEISVVCPPGTDLLDVLCARDELTGVFATVWLKAKWVCPPPDTSYVNGYYCPARDFLLRTTVNGTLRFNPENIADIGSVDPPRPDCPEGFLIVWAIDNEVTQRPISYNGLLGDAVLRPTNRTHVAAYNAVAIQSNLPTGVLANTTTYLNFNGEQYRRLTERFFGTVRYEDANTRTFLTLVPLDVQASTNFNYDNFVEFVFYNENEVPISSDTNVICWKRVEVPTTSEVEGVKGLVSVRNTSGYPILGIIRTQEVIPGTATFRGYAYSVYNDPDTETYGFFCQGAACD